MVKSDVFNLKNRLITLSDTKPFWEVVEEVIKIWSKKEPSNWKSYVIHLDAVKQDQRRTRVGGSTWRGVSRLDGHERSMIVDMPVWIYMCIKKLYPDRQEFLRSKEFFRGFARRFKTFAIRERV